MASLETPDQIANLALSLWDAHVEDCASEHELTVAVAGGLIQRGLPNEAGAAVAALTRRALNEIAGGETVAEPLRSHPVFQALLVQLRDGGWDVGALRLA